MSVVNVLNKVDLVNAMGMRLDCLVDGSYQFDLHGQTIRIEYWEAHSMTEAEELAADMILTVLGKMVAERI